MPDFLHAGARCAALGGERQQRHARLLAQNPPGAHRGGQSNVGQLLGRRVDIHCTVRVNKGLVLLAKKVGHDHEEIARRRPNARQQTHRQHTGLNQDGSRAGNPANGCVRIAAGDHHTPIQQRLAKHVLRYGRADPLPVKAVSLGIEVQLLTGPRVDPHYAVERDTRVRSRSLDLFRRAQDDGLGYALGLQPLCSLDDSLIPALRQDHREMSLPRFLSEELDHIHTRRLPLAREREICHDLILASWH